MSQNTAFLSQMHSDRDAAMARLFTYSFLKEFCYFRYFSWVWDRGNLGLGHHLSFNIKTRMLVPKKRILVPKMRIWIPRKGILDPKMRTIVQKVRILVPIIRIQVPKMRILVPK